MALKPCKECGSKVSTKAQTCPQCGIKDPGKKKTSLATKLFTWLIVVPVIFVVVIATLPEEPTSKQGVNKATATQNTKPTPPPTAEEIRANKIESQFSIWDGSHQPSERIVKRLLNDPNSFDHVESRYADQGDALKVVMTYRAKNGFGGVVPGKFSAKYTLDGDLIEVIQAE